jgi:serine/threonine protein kinase
MSTRENGTGAGGTSRVFKGKYRGDPVAIKMLYCVTLTPETVENFFQESRLLSRLRHPNIVHMVGVCVMPPAICMVMELCKGSLFENLRLPGLKLDWDQRLCMALDCARVSDFSRASFGDSVTSHAPRLATQ